MILIDFSQIMISNIMMHLKMSKGALLEENLVRHMVLNSLRSYRSKFGKEYGELVICCDDKDVWRKDIYPEYKANRKKGRDDAFVDWNELFTIIHMIRDELRENMPYKILQIPRTEADDIIGTLCMDYGVYLNSSSDPKILILSGDKDFVQLQKFANVYQYSPVQKKYITENNPEQFLKEHIMIGDVGDGVPNFISDDDAFVNVNKRQNPLSRKKVAEWSRLDEDTLKTTLPNWTGYERNKAMIDLEAIPREYQLEISLHFQNCVVNDRNKIIPYFMKYRLSQLTHALGDF